MSVRPQHDSAPNATLAMADIPVDLHKYGCPLHVNLQSQQLLCTSSPF